jgi:regulator of sirC expression with transglutaminase-like and TPR domain
MNLNTALTRLSEDPAAPLDLAEVALLLARDEYPDLDVAGYLAELTAMAHEVRRSLCGSFAARVERLCRYLYHELGFGGNTTDYYDPRNSYLNQVLDRRTGIPITLSAVAMAIGQRAGLNVVGVALPGHFVVKAVAGEQEIIFDPFHGGRRLTVAECADLVRQVTGEAFEASEEVLRPALLGPLVVRMLTNLKGTYLRGGDFARAVKVLQRLRQLQPDDPYQQRDLGVALLHAGRPGHAIEHLTAFLDAAPANDEADAVKQLLQRARNEVARWN